MPKYKTHLIGGLATFLLISVISYKTQKFNFTLEQSLLFLPLCLLGSLFPDIDTKSKIQKWLYYLIFFMILTTVLTKKWLALSFFSLIAFIPLLTNHRNLTHKLWFVFLIPLSIPILAFQYNKTLFISALASYVFFASGAFSHLLLDFGPFKLFNLWPKRHFKKFR